jgi:hypothetical protein
MWAIHAPKSVTEVIFTHGTLAMRHIISAWPRDMSSSTSIRKRIAGHA